MAYIFNGGTQPLVNRWGGGVVRPGECIEVDNPRQYAADRADSPWTTDDEALRALEELEQHA